MNDGFDQVVHSRVYLLTFSTYGTRLHGDARGTVDRSHNRAGQPLAGRDPDRAMKELLLLRFEPMLLVAARRTIVTATVREVCEHRDWSLLALNVRTNHVHAVLAGLALPEKMMNDLKAYSTRRLIEAHECEPGRRVWTRNGSARWLCSPRSVEAACRYVCEGQGEDLAGGGAQGLAAARSRCLRD